jgi:hypothetical protein
MGTLSLHQLLPPPKTSRRSITRLNRLGVGDQDFRPGSDKEDGDGGIEVIMSSKDPLDRAPDDRRPDKRVGKDGGVLGPTASSPPCLETNAEERILRGGGWSGDYRKGDSVVDEDEKRWEDGSIAEQVVRVLLLPLVAVFKLFFLLPPFPGRGGVTPKASRCLVRSVAPGHEPRGKRIVWRHAENAQRSWEGAVSAAREARFNSEIAPL